MDAGRSRDRGRRVFLRRGALAFAALGLGARPAADPPADRDELFELARRLEQLYAQGPLGGERWGRAARVRLPDGRELPREQAYRDHPGFAAAARLLFESAEDQRAALGAYLLASARGAASAQAAAVLLEGLQRRQGLAAFEAARGLAGVARPSDLAALEAALRTLPVGPTRSAAAWSAERVAGREPPPRAVGPLAPSFGRGVCWWYEGQDDDRGRASFAALRLLGVDWISIHTWDPLQRAVDDPRLLGHERIHAPRDLQGIVGEAHAAGLRVLYKPHLEMGPAPLSASERALLRGADSPARRELLQALGTRRAAQGWHGAIEMRGERDWELWFGAYGDYVLEHARRAGQAGCDAFCVGRELDRTVLARERQWRALIGRTRAAFPRALTYSAHHADFDALPFWDALDAVGVAAYFPLASGDRPSDAELQAGAQAALRRLAAFAGRAGRALWLTEAGYPALRTAAQRPWDEPRTAAPDAWLQARCFEALLQVLHGVPEIGGLFAWLWEGVSQPPWRDPSFTLKDKPAAFVLARHYRGLGEP